MRILYLLVLITTTISFATKWRIPEDFPQDKRIQRGINEASSGDTVSVWLKGDSNPTYFNENINFRGKNILVVNRSYIENIQNYPPSPVYIIIDGQHNGRVVTIDSNETNDAVLKGFTIQNGYAESPNNWGGGIRIDSASPTITNNIIRNNRADFAGGGIASGRYGGLIKYPIIKNNIIASNYAQNFGGGINVESDTVELLDNIFVYDTCYNGHGGGGIRLSSCGLGAVIKGNIVDSNYSGGFNAGGGILFEGCHNTLVRVNTFRENTCGYLAEDFGWGIYIVDSLPDLGISADHGFNVIMNNDGKDLYQDVAEDTLSAEGNYWGTLDVDTLLAHTGHLTANGQPVDFDPVAASNRVAGVTYNSQCSTSVIVTGDLTVNSGVTLTVVPGKAFKFATTDDYGDDALCKLIVNGELHAIGTANQKITFTSLAASPQAGDWYGVGLKENSIGTFDNCSLKFAYCGIDAENSDTLLVDSSIIQFNQVKGININGSQSAEITRSKISYNGAYGIYCEDASPSIIDNELQGNQTYGIYVNGNQDDFTVSGNQITGPSPSPVEPSLYGIVLAGTTGEMNSVNNNDIEDWDQGGVYCNNEAEARLDTNTILDNECYGILCSDHSSPCVRWCTINEHNTGVYCEGNSYPDLGNEPDSGNNSILMDNTYWVVNANDLGEYVMAEYNWWGTDRPDRYPEKFIGQVDYDPWLDSEPAGEGGQSAGIIKPTLTFALYTPKPNPAIREVRIAYSLPSRCKSELIICDVSGRIITRTTEDKEPGLYEYLWHGRDQRGKAVPNGIYLVRLKAGDKLQTRKIILTK